MSPPGPRRVVGVIPAAGASRRMGRSKAFLHIDGATFLHRVVQALDEGGCERVYVVVEAGDRETRAEAEAAGATVLENPDPGEGPITSLRLALSAVSGTTDAVLYLPVDHALVEPRHVSRLLEAAGSAGARLALPVHEGKRGHPAYFSRDLFPELLDPGLEGGARVVVHRHLDQACLVQTDDPAVVVDIDTPDAYEEARALHRSHRGEDA